MQIASTVARYLLGLMFTIFGLNGFFNFIPAPPMTGTALQYMTVMAASHYMAIVFVLEIICGLIFLSGRYISLGLTLVAPVLVNILIFHVLMNPAGIVPGVIATICWLLVFSTVRPAFAGLLR